MQDIKVWGFLAGLGMFLLGMYMLEQGLRGIGSKSMRTFLRNQTKSPIRGVFTGTVVTTFLQSSSLVGLIVLAFVGAGILELRNAIGIIIGSNLGTTFTGWMVTIIGFKLDLISYAQPMLTVGALGTVFLKQNKHPYFYSNMILGLGLLLLGLTEMKDSFALLTETVDVSFFHGHNLFFYFIAGAIFTAVIQSSSVAMLIVLSAMHSGIFTLQEAAPIVIGADLGTTSTVLLGALKGSKEKRRVALSHFFFNVFTDLIALLILPVILYFIINILKMQDPLLSVVMFHSIFNVIGICLFVPFIDHFIRFLNWVLPDDKTETIESCPYVKKVSAQVTDAAIEAVRKELFSMAQQAIKLNIRCFKIKKKNIFPESILESSHKHSNYDDAYAFLKRTEGEILGYTFIVQSNSEDIDDQSELTQLNHAVRNVNYASKFIKDIRHNLINFRHSESTVIKNLYDQYKKEVTHIYRKLFTLFMNTNPELALENYLDLKSYIRQSYEGFIQNIYSTSGEDRIDDMDTSSLLNVNRAFYLSNVALIESARVYLNLEETPDTIEIKPIITKHEKQ